MSQRGQSPSSTNIAAHAPVTAESLNRGCACRTLDPERLRRQLEVEPTLAGLYEDIARSRPNLFLSRRYSFRLNSIGAWRPLSLRLNAWQHCRHIGRRRWPRVPDIARLDHARRGVTVRPVVFLLRSCYMLSFMHKGSESIDTTMGNGAQVFRCGISERCRPLNNHRDRVVMTWPN